MDLESPALASAIESTHERNQGSPVPLSISTGYAISRSMPCNTDPPAPISQQKEPPSLSLAGGPSGDKHGEPPPSNVPFVQYNPEKTWNRFEYEAEALWSSTPPVPHRRSGNPAIGAVVVVKRDRAQPIPQVAKPTAHGSFFFCSPPSNYPLLFLAQYSTYVLLTFSNVLGSVHSIYLDIFIRPPPGFLD